MAKNGYNNDGEPAKYCRKVIDGGYRHSVSKSLRFNDGHCMFSEYHIDLFAEHLFNGRERAHAKYNLKGHFQDDIDEVKKMIDRVMVLDVDNISKKRGKLALRVLREAVVTCLLFENVKELYSLYSKSEYESLFEFKLEVSKMLSKLVVKFGVEDRLYGYESFGGRLPQLDANGSTDEEDVSEDYDSDDFDAMAWRAIKEADC